MKATLEFNLDDVEDRMAHYRCVKALDMALALWQIKQLFYNRDDEEGISVDKLLAIFEDYNIEIEELTR